MKVTNLWYLLKKIHYIFIAMTGACFANAVGVAHATVILDDQMTSSTYAQSAFRHPYDGRLHLPGTSWCAQSGTGNQDWLKVDLGRTFEICGVATQGLDPSNPRRHNAWVVDFKIHYSLDGNGWTIYRDLAGVEMVRFYLLSIS